MAIIALTVGLSGCERITRIVTEDPTAPPQTLDKSVSIGIAVVLTGEYAEPYGLPMKRGLDLAREEINAIGDVNLTFVSADAQSTVAGGVAAVQDLVDQGVPAIIGIGISTHLEDAFPIVQENEPECNQRLGGWVSQTSGPPVASQCAENAEGTL